MCTVPASIKCTGTVVSKDVWPQVLLSVLASEPRGGHVIRRLQQEVQKQATRANHDVTPITMALMAGFQHSKAAHNLSSMLSKDTLNPADIVQLHRPVVVGFLHFLQRQIVVLIVWNFYC